MRLPWVYIATRKWSLFRTALVLIVVVPLLGASSAVCQLVWDERQLEQQATAFDLERTFSFMFRNDGDYPVTITSLTSSCGCTTAALTKERYAPGEEGTIEAVFDIGDRHGPQAKTLTVRTDDPRKPVVTLTVKLDIDQVIELQPRMLLWRKGEPREPKVAQVLVHRPDLLQLQGVESAEPDFTPTWQPPQPPEVEAGKGDVNSSRENRGLVNAEDSKSDIEDKIRPGIPLVHRVWVEPPPDGPAQKALLALVPENDLPEGVILPTLVVRTLGPPSPPQAPSDE